MSLWLLAAREVYEAGGHKPANLIHTAQWGVDGGRRLGIFEPALGRGGPFIKADVILTPLGIALVERRVEYYTPYVPAKTSGRAKGSTKRFRATWLGPLAPAFDSGQTVQTVTRKVVDSDS